MRFPSWLEYGLIALVALIISGVALLWLTGNSYIFSYLTYTAHQETRYGPYYRVTAKFNYKGEPQLFDYVVGCAEQVVDFKDGSHSSEFGILPAVYGKRMADGKSVVIRAPDSCSGQTTANGGVSADFIPLMVVYDESVRLDNGLAYITEDAYFDASAELSLPSLEINSATKEEFDRFVSQDQTNIVPRQSNWASASPYLIIPSKKGPKPLKMAFNCYYINRIQLPELVRQRINLRRPGGAPQYWFASSYNEFNNFFEGIGAPYPAFIAPITSFANDQQDGQFSRYMDGFRRFISADLGGVPTRNKAFIDFLPQEGPMMSVYPADTNLLTRDWPANNNQWDNFIRAHANDITAELKFGAYVPRGFAACNSANPPPRRIKEGELPYDSVLRLATLGVKTGYLVNGQRITGNDPGYASILDKRAEPKEFFEGDAYLIQIEQMSFDQVEQK